MLLLGADFINVVGFLQAFYFWKYLLTVGGDEQQEMAISPLILNILGALFLEYIPYMYMHPSTMLEWNVKDPTGFCQNPTCLAHC